MLMNYGLLPTTPRTSTTVLHGIPKIEEVSRMLEVLQSIGITIEHSGENTIKLTPPKKFALDKMNIESAKKMRSVLMLIAPLLHSEKKISIPHAGGCQMGDRTIEAHRHGLEALGAKIETRTDDYLIYFGGRTPKVEKKSFGSDVLSFTS